MNKSKFLEVRINPFFKLWGWLYGLFVFRRSMSALEVWTCIDRGRAFKQLRALERKYEKLRKEKEKVEIAWQRAILEDKQLHRKELHEAKKKTREAQKKIESLESKTAIQEAEIMLLTRIMEKYGHREELATAKLIAEKEVITTPPQPR